MMSLFAVVTLGVHALIARYWLEAIAGIATRAEIASEYRYRRSVPDPKGLFITISQSGETADTLAALEHAKSLGYASTLSICNAEKSGCRGSPKSAGDTR